MHLTSIRPQCKEEGADLVIPRQLLATRSAAGRWLGSQRHRAAYLGSRLAMQQRDEAKAWLPAGSAELGV